MNLLEIVQDKQQSEFYPTPESLVDKILDGIEWYKIETILEPSAGKGDILRRIAEKSDKHKRHALDVDCIEFDPYLRQILKYNFSEERKHGILGEIRQIENKRRYDRALGGMVGLTKEDEEKIKRLDMESKGFFNKGIHIVSDDFLTFKTYKKYDLIVMNPPFSDGDKHLLKALKLQKSGGNIICLLNAETIRNPYSETRKELKRQLDKYGAVIEFIQDAFAKAERKADVDVALIKVHIQETQEESEIYTRMRQAERLDEVDTEETSLTFADYIKMIVSQFNVEVRSGIELIRTYRALKPHMLTSFNETSRYNNSILRLTDNNDRCYNDVSINSFLKKVRSKYWEALLRNPKFTGKLTSKLQEEYSEKVDKLSDYDFSEFNINTISAEMNMQIKSGIEEEIIKMFDRLTVEHSYYPECKNNKHLYDGWKTNAAHKIGKKVIIPCYGIFSSWDGSKKTYEARGVLSDIEKILNYLDGGMTLEVNLSSRVDSNFSAGNTKNIQCKYFKATFYKKGTVHLVFDCPELIERFNIYAAQQKQWLPPSYGKKAYRNMDEQEKAVIDSFQGEKAYGEVLNKSSFYLSPVVQQQMLLTEQSKTEEETEVRK